MTPSTNSPSNFSGLTTMFKKQNKSVTLLLLISVIACGTGIGNGFRDPTNSGISTTPISLPPLSQGEINEPINEYNADNSVVDCGSFTQNSTLNEVDQGRSCIYESFHSGEGCIEAKYLLNKTNADGSRFVSFVKVSTDDMGGDCKLRVHTVSNVQPENIGNVIRTCTTLGQNEIPETACGILD